jgi:hypothetical protein
MKKKAYFSLLQGLLLLLVGQQAYAQTSTISDFKVDGGTSINAYPSQSTARIAAFTLKLTKSVGTSEPAPVIKLIRRDNGFNQETSVNNLSVGPVNFVYNVSGNYTATVTGTFRLDYNEVGQFGTTALRASLTCCGTSPPTSNEVSVIAKTNLSDAVTITSFTVEGSKALSISSAAKTVTYVLGLSKDPGYPDDVSITIRGNAGFSDTFSPAIISANRSTTSSSWPLSGTKRVGTITQAFSISTRDVGASDNNLAAVVTSLGGQVPLALTPRTSSTQTTAVALTQTTPPCASDVYLQNTSSLTGRISAGLILHAGRRVDLNSTLGDVLIRAGQTVTFAANTSVLLEEGFGVEAGASFAASQVDNVCSSQLVAEDPPQEYIAYEPSNQSATAQADVARRSANTVGMQEQVTKAYPNPASESIFIPDGSENVTLFNKSGVKVKAVNTAGQLNIQSLPEGLYNLQMQQNGKVINQHIEVKH